VKNFAGQSLCENAESVKVWGQNGAVSGGCFAVRLLDGLYLAGVVDVVQGDACDPFRQRRLPGGGTLKILRGERGDGVA